MRVPTPAQINRLPAGIARDVHRLVAASTAAATAGEMALADLLAGLAIGCVTAYDPTMRAGLVERTRWSPALVAAGRLADQLLTPARQMTR